MPGAGLQPARPLGSRDFKSLASSSFATRAVLGILPPGLEGMAGVGIEPVRLSYRNCGLLPVVHAVTRTVTLPCYYPLQGVFSLAFTEHSIAQDARRLGTA